MTTPGRWGRELLGHRLVQPDARSCGAAALVIAQAVLDDSYAELLVTGTHPRTGWGLIGEGPVDRFRAETLAMHHRVTGFADLIGRIQLPWPRLLGTPPWAVAHQLTATTRTPYRIRLAGRSWLPDSVCPALADGHPVALYVGDRWLPRHVLMAIGLTERGDLLAFDPALGRTVSLTRASLESAELPGRWPRPWFAVGPR